jgi:hypothetical protein
MLDFDAHTRFADATAELMRSCAVAAAQTMAASTCHGLTLWSDMLRIPERRSAPPQAIRTSIANPFEVFWRFTPADWMPKSSVWPQSSWMPGRASGFGWAPYAAWPTFGDWTAWSRIYWPAWSSQPHQANVFAVPETITRTALQAATPSAYASYRSSGGHAVAQVIMPSADTVVAGLAATSLALTQMHTVLSTWRTLLGA